MNKLVKTCDLYECNVPYLKDLFDSCEYPWQMLPKIKDLILSLIETGLEGFTELKPGVLVGKDLRFDATTGRVITDRKMISKDDKSSGIKSADDATAEALIKNTYKTLLTRGQKGCYIYCEDKALREYIRAITSRKDV